MNSGQKKLIVAVVLLIVAVGIYFYFGRDSGPQPNTVKFVCVATGKVYNLSWDEIPSFLPARNPSTGENTLIPVVEEDGKLYASEPHAYRLLQDPNLAKVNKYVDPQTLEVRSSPQ
jgi:hypothetical protein